jgi:hypothetical protein
VWNKQITSNKIKTVEGTQARSFGVAGKKWSKNRLTERKKPKLTKITKAHLVLFLYPLQSRTLRNGVKRYDLGEDGRKQKQKQKQKHTTAGIRWWSPTQLLICRSEACVWQSGRDAQFPSVYGRM